MPLPFLLAGLGIAAGIIGAGGHLDAKETNEKAQKISEEAQKLYNSAKYSLEQARNKTEQSLLKLGYAKKKTLDCSMKQFLNSYDKIKHISISESIGLNEISNFSIDPQDAIQLRQMSDIYSSSIQSGVTGAATGAIVALAASGSLTLVTSELAVAGSFLAAGEIGAAAGIAGSALSFGATMTPLAAVAAPVVLFTGISASLKADENLEKAQVMYAEAEEACEKMKLSEILCDAISDRSEMFNDLLVELDDMFSECTGLLAGVVRKREGRIFKKKLTSADFSENELKLIAVTRALAGAIKAVIDTPILNKDGNISNESQDTYEQTTYQLEAFSNTMKDINKIDYGVKPIIVKQSNSYKSVKNQSNFTDGTFLIILRNMFALVIGFYFATFFSRKLTLLITTERRKVLGIDSFLANRFAIWLIIFSLCIMLIATFSDKVWEKVIGCGTGVGITILYFEYARVASNMNHYIIFNIAILIIISILSNGLDKIKDAFPLTMYLYNMCMSLVAYPIFFLIYSFLSRVIGISVNISFAISIFGVGCGIIGIMSESQEKT